MIGYLKGIMTQTQSQIETAEADEMVKNATTYVENMDIQNAIPLYIKAADIYEKYFYTNKFSTITIKAARLSMQCENYPVAIQLFEKVVSKNADNDLTKWSNTEYLLNATLIHILQGNFLLHISRYTNMLLHTHFLKSREGKFLTDLWQSIEKGDEKMYTSTVTEYDEITRLDPLKVTMLSRIRENYFNNL